MKTFLLTISGIAALSLPSCIDPQIATTSGQNRFGYNGTTSANNQPISGVSQGVVTDPVATTGVVQNTQAQVTPVQNTGNDTIPIDTLPTNNRTNTTSNNTSNTPPTNNNNVATNDTTTSTSGTPTEPEKPKKPEYLYGIPVPGRDGMVYSPYNKDAGYIDVRHMKPGALAEDPYTPGKLFRVP